MDVGSLGGGGQLGLVTASCCFNLFSNSAWCALYTYTPECFPTNVRSRCAAGAWIRLDISVFRGVAIVSALHSFAGILGPVGSGFVVSDHADVVLVVLSAAV